jgi:periplasmic mercuric ion binding protein
MKNIISIITLIFIFPIFGLHEYGSLRAQNSRNSTIKIGTSAQCEMCTHRIEETLTFEKGIKSAKLDLETGIVTVAYRTNRTNPEKIRNAISKTGYDADDVKADPDAYAKLPGCCKKPEDPAYFKHQKK